MVVLDTDGVVQLLRSEMDRAGGPTAFSKKIRVDRATVHRTLKRELRPSKSIIKALDLRVVYAPKREKFKASGLAKDGFDDPRIEFFVLKDGKPWLSIDGRPVKFPQAQVALLACLYNELGRVVPYDRLCRVIGHRSSQERQLHILRQQMLLVRQLLAKHKPGCFLAVSAGVSYALCEVAAAD
jgi:DNA-binding response OmpR family regulator